MSCPITQHPHETAALDSFLFRCHQASVSARIKMQKAKEEQRKCKMKEGHLPLGRMRYLYSMSQPPGSCPTPSHMGYRAGSVRSSSALSGSQYPSASQPPVTQTSHPNLVSACRRNVTGEVEVRLEKQFHVSNVLA